MKINPFEFKDYIEEARDLITDQFKDKPVFNKFLDLLLSPNMEVQEVFRQLMQERSLDTAIGAQLDLLGELVGQPRTLINADLLTFFGFLGEITADSYGDLNDPSVGSIWWDAEQPTRGNITLSDDLYRLLIKAKIAKNVTRATPEDLMRFANFVFSTHSSTVIEEGGASFRIMIGRLLTRQEVGLLRWINETAYYNSKLLPKPIGVNMNYGDFNADSVFAFQGVPNARGYGDLVFNYFYDGTHIHDGSVTPGAHLRRDGDGEYLGGFWASYREI